MAILQPTNSFSFSELDRHGHDHPSPYQVTLLIRALNADILVLIELVKDIFGKTLRGKATKSRIPALLLSTFLVFSLSIICR